MHTGRPDLAISKHTNVLETLLNIKLEEEKPET
jgi:hypothetical protein